jgi:hypothetical protein
LVVRVTSEDSLDELLDVLDEDFELELNDRLDELELVDELELEELDELLELLELLEDSDELELELDVELELELVDELELDELELELDDELELELELELDELDDELELDELLDDLGQKYKLKTYILSVDVIKILSTGNPIQAAIKPILWIRFGSNASVTSIILFPFVSQILTLTSPGSLSPDTPNINCSACQYGKLPLLNRSKVHVPPIFSNSHCPLLGLSGGVGNQVQIPAVASQYVGPL